MSAPVNGGIPADGAPSDFINTFVMQPVTDRNRLEFVLESSENGPEGVTGSLTCEIVSPNEFVELFELATPDAPEMVRIRNRWRREE